MHQYLDAEIIPSTHKLYAHQKIALCISIYTLRVYTRLDGCSNLHVTRILPYTCILILAQWYDRRTHVHMRTSTYRHTDWHTHTYTPVPCMWVCPKESSHAVSLSTSSLCASPLFLQSNISSIQLHRTYTCICIRTHTHTHVHVYVHTRPLTHLGHATLTLDTRHSPWTRNTHLGHAQVVVDRSGRLPKMVPATQLREMQKPLFNVVPNSQSSMLACVCATCDPQAGFPPGRMHASVAISLPVYVCKQFFVCVCACTCAHIFAVCICVCVYVCVLHVCKRLFLCVCTGTCVHIFALCICVCIYITCVCIYIYIHTHSHVCTYTKHKLRAHVLIAHLFFVLYICIYMCIWMSLYKFSHLCCVYSVVCIRNYLNVHMIIWTYSRFDSLSQACDVCVCMCFMCMWVYWFIFSTSRCEPRCESPSMYTCMYAYPKKHPKTTHTQLCACQGPESHPEMFMFTLVDICMYVVTWRSRNNTYTQNSVHGMRVPGVGGAPWSVHVGPREGMRWHRLQGPLGRGRRCCGRCWCCCGRCWCCCCRRRQRHWRWWR